MKLNLMGRLASQVVIVLIPPLALIFLVLGTIFLGIATPTEGGAMGAVGIGRVGWSGHRRRLWQRHELAKTGRPEDRQLTQAFGRSVDIPNPVSTAPRGAKRCR